jgi:hypothetical protein
LVSAIQNTPTSNNSSASTISSNSSASENVIVLTPSTINVALNGTYQFTASGGVPPYEYGIVSGTGTIGTTSGLFTAPAAAETDEVGVADATGAYGIATVTVSATGVVSGGSSGSSSGSSSSNSSAIGLTNETNNGLTLSFTPYAAVYTSSMLTFATSGGSGNYKYLASAGSFNGNVFTAPSSSGAITVGVYDVANPSLNASGTLEILASSSSGNSGNSGSSNGSSAAMSPSDALQQIVMTSLGKHDASENMIDGEVCTNVLSFPGIFVDGLGIEDCGGATCKGYQHLCGDQGANTQVITDVYVRTDVAHTTGGAGVSCPSGYTVQGLIADCRWVNGKGGCGGTQPLCVQMSNYVAGMKYVNAITFTEPGAHKNTPSCPAGSTQHGFVADCATTSTSGGTGSCSGNQQLCVGFGQ